MPEQSSSVGMTPHPVIDRGLSSVHDAAALVDRDLDAETFGTTPWSRALRT
jgi:hypothetical protein